MAQPVYVAGGPLAAAAAARLGPAFDTRPWPSGGLPSDEDAVLVVDPTARADVAGARRRLVGVIDDGPGPWPTTWYALVPAGAPASVVRRAVDNAFDDLAAAADRARLERELTELHAIGLQLSAERNLDVLLATILTKAREITHSDAGSLYLVEESADGRAHLRFAAAQNDSVAITFRTATLPLTDDSVAGHVALTGEIVNLADAYAPPAGSPYQINRWFDEQTHYRTKSMLVVPMRIPQGATIGALQLINCKPGARAALAARADVERHVRSYGPRHEQLAASLASQAAVALHNSRLDASIHQLFEGFVKASVTAIESRDPTTSGHSFRVADLTVGLAEALEHCDRGRYRGLRLSVEEVRELRYAALLHDFGKVGVREHVLVKPKKLYPADLERIRHRVELLARDLELRATRRKLEHLLREGRATYAEAAAQLDVELAAARAELDAHLDFIVMANEPSVTPSDVQRELLRIAGRSWEDETGRRRTLITPAEVGILAIARGSLTEQERREIEQHVVHTYQFLAQIPWTRELRRVPEIARSHHEKLDGSGYPFGVGADEIPVQSRMMTIADIYDALTAADRPYKKAVRVEEALDILQHERRDGRIDPDLLDLFIAAKIYERSERR